MSRKLDISKMGIYCTPDDMSKVFEHIERMSSESGKADAMMAVGMTWNFLIEMYDTFEEFGGDSV